jgi:hypothetical protein
MLAKMNYSRRAGLMSDFDVELCVLRTDRCDCCIEFNGTPARHE